MGTKTPKLITQMATLIRMQDVWFDGRATQRNGSTRRTNNKLRQLGYTKADIAEIHRQRRKIITTDDAIKAYREAEACQH